MIILPKVQNMLTQQMKSNDCLLEDDDLLLLLLPSNLVANCNFQHNNMSHKRSPIDTSLLAASKSVVFQPTTTDTKDSIQLSVMRCSIGSLLNLNQQLLIEPSLLDMVERVVSQPTLLN